LSAIIKQKQTTNNKQQQQIKNKNNTKTKTNKIYNPFFRIEYNLNIKDTLLNQQYYLYQNKKIE